MNIYYSDDSVTVYSGDCLEVMRRMPDASADAVVTDPPYGMADISTSKVVQALHYWMSGCRDWVPVGSGFMGHAWDAFVPPPAVWDECLRVLRPGGYLLASAGSRTHDLMAFSIRLADFEIRDSVAWLYGNGFPKSRQHLKPAYEPIIVARRPLEGTVAQNIAVYGTGALNIDRCRVDGRERTEYGLANARRSKVATYGAPSESADFDSTKGRWPANVVLDETAAAELDRQSLGTRASKPSRSGTAGDPDSGTIYNRPVRVESVKYEDAGGASRFFYTAKAAPDERPVIDGVRHPTVKPLSLMRWLVRLVTPPGGIVLDPFAGSGTTAEACVLERLRCIAIEREPSYLPLIRARLSKPLALGFDFEEVPS